MREEQVIEKVKRDFLKDAARLRKLRDEPEKRAADNSSADDLLAEYRWLGKDGNKNDRSFRILSN